MELKHKHRQLIALGIGLLFIIFGLFQAVFGLKVDKKISDEVSFVLFLVAGYLLLSGRNKKSTTKEEVEQLDEKNDLDKNIPKD